MIIGPHINPPPIIAALNMLTGALSDMGAMTDGQINLPSGIGEDGVLVYDSPDVDCRPLLGVFDSETDANGLYARFAERMGDVAGPADGSAFLRMHSEIDAALDTRFGDIAEIFRTVRAPVSMMSAQMSEMAARQDSFKAYSVRQLIHLMHWSGGDDGVRRIPISREALSEMAMDAYFASTLILGDNSYTAIDSARLSFISGLLYWAAGTESDFDDAVDSFEAASIQYHDLGNPVAAAISSEAAVYIAKEKLGKPAVENNSLNVAAERWRDAAKQLRSTDIVGAYLAGYRGMLSAMMARGGRIYATRQELAMRLANIESLRGRDDAAARGYLHRAFDLLKGFKGEPGDWIAIADSIRMTIGALRRAGEAFDQLEELEELARGEARDMKGELAELAERMEPDISDPIYRFKRGQIRMRHGDLSGALQDFEWAKNIDPGNAWFLGEVGHARHQLGYLVAMFGDPKGAEPFMAGAEEYLGLAAEIAEESEEEHPIFTARMGALRISQGQLDEARQWLEAAFRLDPRNREVGAYMDYLERQIARRRAEEGKHLRPVD